MPLSTTARPSARTFGICPTIEALSDRLGPYEPCDDATFQALCEAPDPLALPRLLASIPRPRTKEDADKLLTLAAYAPDPRITEACRRWLVDHDRFRREALTAAYGGIVELVEKNRDPRSMIDLEQHHADHEGNLPPPLSYRDWRLRIGSLRALESLQETCGGVYVLRAQIPEAEHRRWDEITAPVRQRRQLLASIQQELHGVLASGGDERAALRTAAERFDDSGEPIAELLRLQLAERLTPAEQARAAALIPRYRAIYLEPVSDLVDELRPTPQTGIAALRQARPVVIERGALRACAIRVTNLRRLRELGGHPAWSTLEALHWGSDPTFRERFIDTAFVLHPAMCSLRTISGLCLETIDALLDSSTELPFAAVETWRIEPEQLADAARWPYLEALTLAEARADDLHWLDRCPVAHQLDCLEVNDDLEALPAWLALAESACPRLRRLVVRGVGSCDNQSVTMQRGPQGWALAARRRPNEQWRHERAPELSTATRRILDKLPAGTTTDLELHGLEQEPDGEVRELIGAAEAAAIATSPVPRPARVVELTAAERSDEHLDCVALSPSGQLVAEGYRSDDPTGNVVIRRLDDRQVLRRVALASRATHLAFATEEQLVVRDSQCTHSGHDLSRGTQLWSRVLGAGQARPELMPASLSRDGSRSAALLGYQEAVVWSLPDGEERMRLRFDEDQMPSQLWLSPNGELLVVCGRRHELRIHRLGETEPCCVLEGHQGDVRPLAFLDQGRVLLSGGDDDTLRLWRWADGGPHRCYATASGVRGLAVAPDESWALIGVLGLQARSLVDGRVSGRIEDHGIWRDGLILPDGWTVLTGAHPWVRWRVVE